MTSPLALNALSPAALPAGTARPVLEITSHTRSTEAPSGGEGFFGTLVDIINPLQHIPLVSQLYRAVTGDKMSGPGHILGGLLFGGPLGFMTGMASAVFDQVEGSSTGPAQAKTALSAYHQADAASASSGSTTTLQI